MSLIVAWGSRKLTVARVDTRSCCRAAAEVACVSWTAVLSVNVFDV